MEDTFFLRNCEPAGRLPYEYPWAHNYFSGIGKFDGCMAE